MVPQGFLIALFWFLNYESLSFQNYRGRGSKINLVITLYDITSISLPGIMPNIGWHWKRAFQFYLGRKEKRKSKQIKNTMGFKVLSIFHCLPMTVFLEHWSYLLKRVKSELLRDQPIYSFIERHIALTYFIIYSG